MSHKKTNLSFVDGGAWALLSGPETSGFPHRSSLLRDPEISPSFACPDITPSFFPRTLSQDQVEIEKGPGSVLGALR